MTVMQETQQQAGTTVCIKGGEPHGNDPLEAWVTLSGVPSPGDQIEVWMGDHEAFVEIESVTWPTWQYAHDPGEQAPVLWLRRADTTDDEWREVFTAMKEKRHP